MYTSTVILNRAEEQFWRMTLRKLIALYDEHKAVQANLKKQEAELLILEIAQKGEKHNICILKYEDSIYPIEIKNSKQNQSANSSNFC